MHVLGRCQMRYVSIFSGVEAATLAWEPLGWEPLAFCEIDDFPSAVLAERWPNVPNLGDINKVDWKKEIHGAVDLVVGGSPCQSFSIAGKREGLKGASGLMFEYIRCVQELMPRWFLWENVKGALSCEGGGGFRTAPARNGCPRVRFGVASSGRAVLRRGPKARTSLSCRTPWRRTRLRSTL